jgi:hypothetical protein
MDIGANPHVCVDFLLMFFMFVLSVTDVLRCAWLMYPLLVLVTGDGD